FTARERITVLEVVPSLLSGMLDPLAASGGTIDLSRLEWMIVTGEACPPDLADRWLALAPHTRLLNAYGPTECSDDVTHYERVRPGSRPEPSLPIGRPVANTRIHVLDPGGRPAPQGVPGELCVAGRGVGRGYLGLPDRTAQVFVPDAWSGEPGSRLYRTGDLARWRTDGTLEFLGRLDHQVKVRGFRIELGEIESLLVAFEGVHEAVVLVRQDTPGDQRLVAYVTGDVAAEALRRSLSEQLPDYMVPAAFVTLAALPLTPNGKVDRKALPAPEWQDSEESHRVPRTPVEEVLAGLWAELLGLERVGRGGHFFDLGGHSLLATRVMSRLRSTFGVEMPLRDLFEAPRLADLAARIEAARRAGAVPPAPPLVPVPRQGPLPLSFAQQRLWLLDQLEPGSPLYHMRVALRASGPLDGAVLARCLGEVVRRHETLRTVFAAPDGSPVQVIRPAVPFVLPRVDLSGLPASRREPLAIALAGDEALRPFDLARGPLLRGVLLRLAEGEQILALTLHHIASDGWSVGLLVREVKALYAAFAEGRPSPLPDLPLQYGDFAVWQREWLRGEVLETQLAWWKERLADLPAPVDLPMERSRPATRSFRGGVADRVLSPGLSRRIEGLGRQEGTTPFMVLLAALAALLHRSTGEDDLVLGTLIAGRTRAETEGLIGFFLNTLALRIDLAGDPTVRELLSRVRQTVLGASDHQDVPFELLLEELRPERDLARTPLFQVVLNWLSFGTGKERFELPGLALEQLPPASHFAKFDLEIYADPSAGPIALHALYNRDLFAPSQIDELLTHLEALLAGMVAGAGRRLS
ncbi:MAG TPA: condensation domain-containing protein, partial [Thermoanaerobaculia bacterium]